MRIFESKNMGLFKKLIIFVLILIIIGFSFSGEVQAKDSAKGGKLLNPIGELLVFTGDGIMNIVHTILYSQTDTTISVDLTMSILGVVATIAIGLIAAAFAAVVCVVTCGAFAAVLATIGLSIATVSAGTVLIVAGVAGVCAAVAFNANVLPDVLEIPVYQISPDKIFSNEVLLLDVDFFNPKEDEPLTDRDGNIVYNDDGSIKYIQSTAKQLRTTISNWYTVLRDIAVVALLSILVYIGIRILISSTSNDKAKYKQMLTDWVVAICLLFVMQYIMSFSNLIVGKFTELITSTKTADGYTPFIADKNGKVSEKLDDLGYTYTKENVDGEDYIAWPTNSLGFARLEAQMAKNENTTYAGYALVFFALVLFTVYFIITYLKRVLYMAFLTLIAPLVAMTYPIDKINDGKAQAFNMWFKEYIFNLLIQPMHLLLYTVLVTSAYELASTNIIYSLVALGFMIPAEKLLRKFFGFEKAQTPGLLAGPAGAALMMNGMNKLLGKGPKGPGKHPSGNGEKSNSGDNGKPPRVNKGFDKDGALFGDGNTPPLGDGSGGANTNDNDFTTGSNDRSNNQVADNNNPYDDNIIDLSEDEYTIRNAGTPLLGNSSMNNTDSGSGTNNGRNNTSSDNNNNGKDDDDNSSYTPPIKYNSGTNSGTETSGTNSRSSQNNEDSKFKRVLKAAKRGATSGARYYGRGMARQAKNGIKNMHPVKAATRFAAGAAGAAALGAAGLAIGVTSGDLSKAAQYTGAAAMGGYKMTTGIKDGFDSLTPDGIQEVTERAAYGSDEEYEKAKQEKYIREYQKNEKNRFELEKRYGRKKSNEIMKNDIPQFLDNGVTDMKDITTILEMMDNKQIKDIDEGIAVKKYASRIGEDSTKMTDKKRNEWHKTFSTEFGKKDKYKGYDHNNMADSVLDRVDAYNKIRYSK